VRLLVTGGAGFIGSHYVRSVLTGAWGLAEPDEVVVLDKLTYAGGLDNLAPVRDDPRLRFVQGDICDARTVNTLLADADAVVHLAAESHVDRSILGAAEFVRTNVVGTQTLLDCALASGVDTFVHVSTDEVYGSIAEGSWREDQPLAPNSPYSASKAASDLLALAYVRTHDLLDGGTVPLYGAGANVRDWLHVDDHCRAIHLVLQGGRPGEVYHIGGGTELTNRELTGRLLEACGAGWDRVVAVPDRKGHDLRYSVAIDKIAAELGYAPQVDFDEGLADTVAWYAANRAWWEPRRERARLASSALGADHP
jgi:dTDP-glucose 4,6-dehydratase